MYDSSAILSERLKGTQGFYEEDLKHAQWFDSELNDFDFGELGSVCTPCWWKCDKGHNFKKTLAEFRRYSNCPGCQLIDRGKVIQGVNDLASVHPWIRDYWDECNDFGPEFYLPDSRAKIWHRGSKLPVVDFVQQLKIELNIKSTEGPRIYKGKYLARDEHIGMTHPEIVHWLHPKEEIAKISKYTHCKYKFICPEGHEFTTRPFNVIKANCPCPYCGNRKLLSGFNDMISAHPKLSKELACTSDTKKLASRKRRFKWKCEYGHLWEATLQARSQSNTGCPYCANKKVYPGFNDLLHHFPDITNYWSQSNHLLPSEIIRGSEQLIYLICSKSNCQNEYSIPAYLVSKTDANQRLCESCNRWGTSLGEQAIANFIESLGLEIKRREKINGCEIDIFIPSKNFGIEYNGVYWHSERFGKGKDYHLNKTNICNQANIQLIHIWEDDWIDKEDIVKTSLINKLNLYRGDRAYAKNCTLAEIDKSKAESFLERHHIKGYAQAEQYIGVFIDGNLHGVASIARGEKADYLNRYATDMPILGSLGKVSKSVKRPGIPLISFADKSWSTGDAFYKAGYMFDGELAPDYKYVVGAKRFHKFDYRKSRFKRDDNLIYEDGKTEKELAEMNDLYRIWDCGKLKFVI